MKDEDDILVKDLVEFLGIDQALAIKIMYQIRGNVYKYFRIDQREG